MAGRPKHSHLEIAEAKMLARRLAAAREVRTTLSVFGAARFFLHACWTLLTRPFRRMAERIKQAVFSTMCPHCYGARVDKEGDECRLCSGRGRITTHQQEAVRYGKALAAWRIDQRRSPALAGYMVLGMEGKLELTLRFNSWESWWKAMENGYLLVHEWPEIALEIARQEMFRSGPYDLT